MVVAASNPSSLLPQPSLGIASAAAAQNSFKRLQSVPARRREASPPPAHGVPIVRLDVPAPKQPHGESSAEAMAREQSAALAMMKKKDGKHAAAVTAVAAATAAVKKKKKDKKEKKAKAAPSSSSPSPSRELFPSASLQMRWTEPLKPVRIGIEERTAEEEREKKRRKKREKPRNSHLFLSSSLSFSSNPNKQ